MTPGRNTQGTFTAFWQTFWSSQGNVAMSDEMNDTIFNDVYKANEQIQSRAIAAGKRMKRLESDSVRFAASRARKWSKAVIEQYGREHKNVGYIG